MGGSRPRRLMAPGCSPGRAACAVRGTGAAVLHRAPASRTRWVQRLLGLACEVYCSRCYLSSTLWWEGLQQQQQSRAS